MPVLPIAEITLPSGHGAALLPRADALRALRFVSLWGRRHGDVLGQPRPRRAVVAVAVRQQPVPDDQITGLAVHDFDVEAGHVGETGITVSRLRFHPLIECPVEAGNTLEATLVDGRISQVDHALHANMGCRIRAPGCGDVGAIQRGQFAGVDVPVDHALVAPFRIAGPVRGLHIDAIQ